MGQTLLLYLLWCTVDAFLHCLHGSVRMETNLFKGGCGFLQTSAEFHILFNIIHHFRHKNLNRKNDEAIPKTTLRNSSTSILLSFLRERMLKTTTKTLSTQFCQFQTRLSMKAWMTANMRSSRENVVLHVLSLSKPGSSGLLSKETAYENKK